jgi:hypothetical protein
MLTMKLARQSGRPGDRLTFAVSTVQSDEGYALAESEITAEIRSARGHTKAVGDGFCIAG